MTPLTAFSSIPINVTTDTWTWTPGSRAPIGIHCNAESTIVGALVGDSATDTWVLPAGTSPLAFRTITTASTTKTGFKVLFTR